MDPGAFTQIRHQLGKTQVEVARLLGVSTKSVQSFEQGWRSIPAHVERQLLLLVHLKHPPPPDARPCWEVRACSPQMREGCMAWEAQAGDLCWFLNGTLCQGRACADWAEKMQWCRQCEVFRAKIGKQDL